MIAKAKLGDISYIEMGQSPQSSTVNDRENGIPFLQGSAEFGDVFPKHKFYCTAPQKLCRTGDALMSVRAPVGELNKADKEYCIGRGLAAIRFTGVLPRFGWHMLKFWSTGLTRVAQGSTFEAINGSELSNLEIVYFPENEQCSIADILDTIDAAIQNAERVIAKQKAICAGLLHDLLTYGLDANSEPRDPLNHPEQFQESQLGLIPNDWELAQLLEVVPTIQYGISVSLEDTDGIPVLRMNNLKNGEIDLSELKYSRSVEARTLLLRENDILFNRTNSIEHVGRTSIWRGQLDVVSFASYLVRLEPNIKRLLPEYLNLWLNLPEIQDEIRKYATPGVHQVNINPTNLRKVFMALPKNIDEQGAIVEICEQSRVEIASQHSSLAKLVAQKKGLMDDLLTGRVRVSDVQMDEVMEQK
ncbi:MAG: hypothetical protein GC179_30570 [Anaerolineaceae bacterium]|nr:hypothetical protein [Anaerolineaceae bacterium]